MAIRFNKLIQPGQDAIKTQHIAEEVVYRKATTGEKMVFMSHKTGDLQAEAEARYISNTHRINVYMAEWDNRVYGDSDQLPDHIMAAIRESDGFLVNVIAEIAVSMWIGYEIGGAHAMEKYRAKIMYEQVSLLPSVVDALKSLRNRRELDRWITSIAR